MSALLVLLLLLSCGLTADTCDLVEECEQSIETKQKIRYWQGHLEGRGNYGDFRQGGGLNGFAPIYQNGRSIIFTEGRFYRLKRQTTTGGGIGGRYLFNSHIAAGLNAFCDWGRSDRGVGWWQFSGGAEVFGSCWLARINAFMRSRIEFELTRLLNARKIYNAIALKYTSLQTFSICGAKSKT